MLAGDIRHPPAQMEALWLMLPASMQNQRSLFKAVKRCQIKKV
jgi:hypothetical protein